MTAALFIDGRWVAPLSGTDGAGAETEVVNRFDQSVIAKVAAAGPGDAARAAAAARAAFDRGDWAYSPATERAALLDRVADLLVRDKEQIARTETLDTGKTLAESRADVDDVVRVFRYYATSPTRTPAGWSTPATPPR